MCVHRGLAASREQLQLTLHRDCDQQLLSLSLRCAEHPLARHHQQQQVQVPTMCREHFRRLGEEHGQCLHHQHQVQLFQ